MTTETETKPAPFDFLKVSGLLTSRKKKGPDKKYATFNRRMLAATFDSIFLLVLTPAFNRFVPIKVPNVPLDNPDPQAAERLAHELANPEYIASVIANMTAQMVVFCLFSAVCWHFWSATPGKMIVSIKIADAKTEQPVTDRQILIRVCGYVISAVCFFLGFFWIGFDKRRQGWHDKMADTVVITVPWKQTIGKLFGK